jgi:hypothetical protein
MAKESFLPGRWLAKPLDEYFEEPSTGNLAHLSSCGCPPATGGGGLLQYANEYGTDMLLAWNPDQQNASSLSLDPMDQVGKD